MTIFLTLEYKKPNQTESSLYSYCTTFRLVKNVIVQTRAKVIFVATDQNPMTSKIEEHLKKWKVNDCVTLKYSYTAAM